jgi:hypothetical protein
MKSRKNDYLKYWRVIRYYYKSKYGLNQCDLDMLLFLYSEQYFSKDKFTEFDELLNWDRDRFERLRQAGWIEVFRKRMGHRKALYELSFKCKNMIAEIYRKLNGEEIPMGERSAPMFKKKVDYSDKVYRNMVKEMNESIRQQRRQPHE